MTPRGAFEECNNGNITGHSLQVEDGHYTSRIHVLFSPDLLGHTIECIHSFNTSNELVGNSTIARTTGKLSSIACVDVSEMASLLCVSIFHELNQQFTIK